MNNNVLLVIIVNKVGNVIFLSNSPNTKAKIIHPYLSKNPYQESSDERKETRISGVNEGGRGPVGNHVQNPLGWLVCVLLLFYFNLRVKRQCY